LYGKSNIHAEKTDITITSSTTNGFHVTNNVLIHSSGIGSLEDGDVASYLQTAGNTGFAFDLGATFKPIDKLEVSLSILDIGAGIKWTEKNDSSTYSNNSFDYDGYDFNSEQSFSESMDSLRAALEFDSIAPPTSYKTTLPTKVYLSGSYKVTEKLSAGGLLYLEMGNKTLTSISLVGQYKVSKMLSASLSYSAYNGTFTNIGAGLVFNGGPFQMYLTSDNLLGFDVYGSKGVNFRFGTNFQFGRTDNNKKAKK
jgi:hypothetical protein